MACAMLLVGTATAQSVPTSQTPPSPMSQMQRIQGVEDPVGTCLQEANNKLRQEGPQRALEAFQACVRKAPDSAEVRFSLGKCYFVLQQPKEAAVEFKEGLRLQPDNNEARAMLGKIWSFDDAKLEAAEEVLTKVVQTNPHMEDAIFDLGRVYARRGDAEKAWAHFSRVLASEKRYAIYHFEVGRILVASGAVDAAKTHLERALVLDPGLQMAQEALRGLDGKNDPKSPTAPPSPSETNP